MPWQEQPLESWPLLRRPSDVGTQGRKIRLMTNFFTVGIKNPNVRIFHYNVEIKQPEIGSVRLSKNVQWRLFEDLKKTYPKVFKHCVVGYDCEKNAYSIGAIPTIETEGSHFEIQPLSVKGGAIVISLKLVGQDTVASLVNAMQIGSSQANLPVNIMHMLEVLLQCQPMLKYEKEGRNSFFPAYGEFLPSFYVEGGLEGVLGFFSSLRPLGWKKDTFLLNVDVTSGAFYKEQEIIELVQESLKCKLADLGQPLKPLQRQKLEKDLKHMKVVVTHSKLPRNYKVIGVGELGADRQTFPCIAEDGTTTHITVQQYFLQKYGYKLKFPHLNCLRASPASRTTYLPMEVCKVSKRAKVSRVLSGEEQGQLTRGMVRPPMQRFSAITNVARQQNNAADPIVRALQFDISNQPLTLDGHVLPAPTVLMSSELAPKMGVWNCCNHTFFLGGKLDCWAVLNYDARTVNNGELRKFLSTLCKMSKDRGMSVEEPALVSTVYKPNPEADLQRVNRSLPNIQLIMVILPKCQELYARVKQTGDQTMGIVTQCVKAISVKKCQASTISNILLKVNTKIEGINHVLGANSRLMVFDRPVMIMGADVNHPPAHDTSTPSLAAVVASMNHYASKYAVEARHQKHRTEMIQDLREMTRNLLLAFFRATKRKPELIIMYRDGVSETQFAEVLAFELNAMRDACRDLEKGYEPSMTFICVQKRHHARLFCEERDGMGKNKNVPPGTTVDTIMTHPVERDFYLCSHQGIQGTVSRPTHYRVLWDDADMSKDQLQSITYAMTHMYCRCTQSVSIPAPAYYAHLVAFRAKVHSKEVSCTPAEVKQGMNMSQTVKMESARKISTKMYFV